MALSAKVYNFRRFGPSPAQAAAKENCQKLDEVIRRPFLFTTASTSEFPLHFSNSPKINGFSVLSMSHLKEGNGIDINGVGSDCAFYYKVIYNEEKGRCYDENAFAFHQKWNDSIDFMSKLLELVRNKRTKRMYDRYQSRLQTFDPKNVCFCVFSFIFLFFVCFVWRHVC